jgi:hypothetical protein
MHSTFNAVFLKDPCLDLIYIASSQSQSPKYSAVTICLINDISSKGKMTILQILHSVFGSEQHYFSFVLIQFKHVRTHHKLYCIFSNPIAEICRRHNMTYHFYTDDTQLYLVFEPLENLIDISKRLEDCLTHYFSFVLIQFKHVRTHPWTNFS